MSDEPLAVVELHDLPWPVTLNKLYGYSRKTGRKYLSAEGKDYHWFVKAIVNKQLSVVNLPLTGRLHLDIFCYPKKGRTTDLDNLLKVLLDSLEYNGVYANDAQIDRMMIERRTKRDEPHIDIVIKEYQKLKLTKRPRQ